MNRTGILLIIATAVVGCTALFVLHGVDAHPQIAVAVLVMIIITGFGAASWFGGTRSH